MDITVNGVTLHYACTGQGPPLILLHGNGEDHSIFDKLIEPLALTHTVYAIDSRGHGKSGEVAQLHYADMAEDIAAFVTQMRLDKPGVYGFSDGGIVGLLVAMRYPELLSRLIVSGVNLTPSALKKGILLLMKLGYLLTGKDRYRLMVREPAITGEQLAGIRIPVAVLAGEKDVVPAAHTHFIAAAIPESTVEIIPRENHGSYVVHSEKLYPYIKKYL